VEEIKDNEIEEVFATNIFSFIYLAQVGGGKQDGNAV
jgi:hypothetical protein